MTKSYCPLPWINLATTPTGEVTVCCRANEYGTAMNNSGEKIFLHKDSIESAINSDRFKEIRQKMLAGKYPKSCTDCFFQERSGVESDRQRALENFDLTVSDASAITSEEGEIPVELRHIEIRAGNTCNLKCVTCNPISSSKWIDDYKKLKEKYEIPFGLELEGCSKEMFSWSTNKQFWYELINASPKLEQIFINGGEPTLLPTYIDFLNQLVERDYAKNIKLVYSLNLTNLPEGDYSLWKSFKKVLLHLSIDDIGERNDYIRFPSHWKDVEKNLNALTQTDTEIRVIQTVSAFNFGTLLQLEKWLLKKYPEIKYSHNHVYKPEFLSPLILPPSFRRAILLKHRVFSRRDLAEELEGLYLNNKEIPYGRLLFTKYICGLDSIRETNFERTFPAVAAAIGIHP
ncbi:MAG: twitch domain-containing radical SAM protein [Bacteriovoracaceae bacterium]|nr:twitch domain-containing radical SAM protein [Bacteriovoracaceae bacterium]